MIQGHKVYGFYPLVNRGYVNFVRDTWLIVTSEIVSCLSILLRGENSRVCMFHQLEEAFLCFPPKNLDFNRISTSHHDPITLT